MVEMCHLARVALMTNLDQQECIGLRNELREAREELTVKAGLLEQNIPNVKPLLEEAEDHADDLRRQAERLDKCVRIHAYTHTHVHAYTHTHTHAAWPCADVVP